MTKQQKHKKKLRDNRKRKESRIKQQAGSRKKPLQHRPVIQVGESGDLPAVDKEQAEMIAKWRAEQEVAK